MQDGRKKHFFGGSDAKPANPSERGDSVNFHDLSGYPAKQRENETKNGAHARFEPGTSKSLQKLSFFPPPARLISHLECDEEWKEKIIAVPQSAVILDVVTRGKVDARTSFEQQVEDLAPRLGRRRALSNRSKSSTTCVTFI